MRIDENKNALYLKTKLIDFILNKNTESIIGSEIMYGKKKSLVDIIELVNNKITAYEIKAVNDDFRKLPYQINEYKKVFDYIYIVITPNHLNKIDFYLKNENIGIILIDSNDKVKYLKKSNLQKSNQKDEILATMNASFLKKQFQISSKINSNQTREIISNRSLSTIKKTLYEYLYQLTLSRFNLFLNEKGKETLIDDIAILSLCRKRLLR